MEQKKLCRSMGDKAICGVCSGFARYFDIDPIIIRLVVVLLALTGTLGIWFYIIAAIVMPKDTDVYAQSGYRFDPQTGRPLYSDGTNVYENYAGTWQNSAPGAASDGTFAGNAAPQADEAVDVEFRAEPYAGAEEPAGSPAGDSETPDQADVSGEYNGGAFGAEQPEAETFNGGETCAQDSRSSQSNQENQNGQRNQESQSGQGNQGAQGSGNRQNPYQNFQAYNTQQPRQPRQKPANRSRNTGILLIIIGVVILAKIILPRINVWIPISIASIFFGIFLLCRKN